MKYLLSIVFCFLFSNLFFTQNNSASQVEASFENAIVRLQAGKAFSNTIFLKNNSISPIKIDSVRAVGKYPGLLFSPEYEGVLAPNASQGLKIRMIAGNELLASPLSIVEYWVYSSANNIPAKQKISFSLEREKMDYVSIIQTGEMYYNPSSPENILHFFVENQAYVSRMLRLKIRLSPDDFVTAFPEEQVVSLNPKEKQLVTVQLRKRQNITYYPDYNLSIQVVDDASNSIVSNVVLPVRSLSSYRMVNYGGNVGLNKNFVEASYNNTDNLNQYYKLRTNFEQKLGANSQIGLNATVDYYNQQNLSNVYDTRLDFRFSNYYAGIGNVYGQDYDFNVSGRGLKLGAKIGNGNEVEVLGLDNNYMLYSDYSTGFSAGKTAGMKFSHLFKNKRLAQFNYLYNQNNFSKVNTHLFNFKMPVYADSLQVLSVEGGLSKEDIDINNHQKDKLGGAFGLNYTLQKAKFSIHSNNYFSSPYYSGIRRGALYLDESLNYSLTEYSSLFVRYNSSLNQTSYLSDWVNLGYIPESKFSNQLIEAGWAWNKLTWRFSISPNYTYQNIQTIYNNLEYSAFRSRINIGRSFNRHNLNFSWDGGLSKFNNSTNTIFAQRLIFSYAYKMINLNAMADINPTNAYDLNWYTGGTFVNYSTSLGLKLNALRNKLDGFLNVGYSFMNVQKTDNIYVNANMDYKLSPRWSLTGMAYYSFLQGQGTGLNPSYQYSNLQYKVGVKLALGSSSVGNKLSLKIYEYENLNNKVDATEIPLSNALVRLNNDIIAVTNNKGVVKYANLKDGDYTISVTKNNQRIPLMGMEKLTINKNVKLEIPVVKTITLLGVLSEKKDKYDVQVADYTGINVYAQDLASGKIFVAITEADGSFNFQLVEGKYKVYIQNDRYEILNNHQEIDLKNTGVLPKLIFYFKSKELKIRKRQF